MATYAPQSPALRMVKMMSDKEDNHILGTVCSRRSMHIDQLSTQNATLTLQWDAATGKSPSKVDLAWGSKPEQDHETQSARGEGRRPYM